MGGDRGPLGAALGDQVGGVGALVLQLARMAQNVPLERDHLPDHLLVEAREAVDVVEPGHQVAQVPRAEQEVERRRLGRRVDRDQTLRDHLPALREVVLGDDQLATVDLLLVLDLREPEVCEVDPLVGGGETLIERDDLRIDLLGLCLLRRDRRGAECRGGNEQARRQRTKQQQRLSPPLYDRPRLRTRPAWEQAPARHGRAN